MTSKHTTISLKTETEHLLYKHLTDEQAEREKLQNLVADLKCQINELQRQLEYIQEEKRESPVEKTTKEKALEQVQYETDEEDLAKETEWIRQQSRKKRKLNQSLSPPQQQGPTSSKETKTTKVKRVPQPPPVIVENVKDYQVFYDTLLSCTSSDSFLIKMCNGNSCKINAQSDDSYRAITKLLTQNNSHWYSYENKQERPIRVMAKNLHSSCIPARILEDISDKGYNIQDVTNKLSWRNKEPLNMFILSFDKGEDINKIYNIKSILGCKVDIQPLKTSKLIPQCKRCQAYGHTQKYCSKEPRCVKCIGKHLTKDCKKPAETKPKCVHCVEPHPASYRGCVVAKELQNIKNKSVKKIKTPDHKAPGPNVHKKFMKSQPVTENLSFAQITKGSQARPQVQSQPEPQLSSNLDEKLNKILSVITSFDDRLKKLEHNAKMSIYKQK